MLVIAAYPGTFDPLTNGHLDIIKRSLSFCDVLDIAIGHNPAKTTMFTIDQRIEQIKQVPFIKENASQISIHQFDGLLVEYARKAMVDILIRGIRSVSDFEYEINLAAINKTLAPEIETVFLPTSPDLAVVSSSMVKEIAKLDGDITRFVPDHIASQVYAKFGSNKYGFVKYGDEKNKIAGA